MGKKLNSEIFRFFNKNVVELLIRRISKKMKLIGFKRLYNKYAFLKFNCNRSMAAYLLTAYFE